MQKHLMASQIKIQYDKVFLYFVVKKTIFRLT